MQKKAIVVRKCKSHRAGIAVFAILMFAILTFLHTTNDYFGAFSFVFSNMEYTI